MADPKPERAGADPARLLALAQAISDGQAVDWAAAESSAGDDELRSLVRELQIVAGVAGVHRSADSAASAARVEDGSTASETRARWGPLDIRDRLGSGTFGTVYRAWDPRLAREVALKLLLTERAPTGAASTIIDEGRLLARVRHPNVVTVYGADRFDGRVGVWMEYIKGRTLEQILKQHGPLGAHEATLIGIDLCRALAAVHAAGLVHRDVKAHNVMREDGGRIVLMDFGAGSELVPEGDSRVAVAGTPLYMAPELFTGAEASVRTDVYSLGVLLHHLTTDGYPVAGRTMMEVRAAHQRDARRLLRDERADLPTDFVHAVETATSVDPGQRYESAGAMERALANALRLPSGRAEAALRTAIRTWAAMGAVTTLILIAAWVGWGVLDRRGVGADVPVRSIAVIPLANLATADQEYFSGGTSELLSAKLSKIRALRVIAPSSTLRYKGGSRPPSEVARELNVDALVTGSVSASGQRVRLTIQVIQAGTGQVLWGDSYERSVNQFFTLQGDVARDLIRGIRVSLSPQEEQDLADPVTVRAEAQQAYLKGAAAMQTIGESGLKMAAQQFERAVEIDPQYARAYASLSYVYSLLGTGYRSLTRAESYERTRAAATRALELDDRLPSGHYAMALVKFRFDWDWPEAEAHFLRALELSPSDANAHQQYGVFLAAMGRLAASVQEIRRARELDPFFNQRRSTLAMALYYSGDYDAAQAELEAALKADHEFEVARFGLARVYEAKQMFRDALAQLDQLRERSDGGTQAEFARVHALLGDRDQAAAIVARLEKARADGALNVSAESLAHAHLALGNRDRALDWLERGYNEKSSAIFWIKVDPRLEEIRSDPRFVTLLRRLRLL